MKCLSKRDYVSWSHWYQSWWSSAQRNERPTALSYRLGSNYSGTKKIHTQLAHTDSHKDQGESELASLKNYAELSRSGNVSGMAGSYSIIVLARTREELRLMSTIITIPFFKTVHI